MFLDCVDENKKDVIRSIFEKQVNHDSSLQPKNTGTRVLIEQVCTNKETLILLFEELFGREQPRELPLKSNGKVRTESSNTLKRIDRFNQRGNSMTAASELDPDIPIEDLVNYSKSLS